MSTENESRQEGAANEENQNVSRDGGYKSYCEQPISRDSERKGGYFCECE